MSKNMAINELLKNPKQRNIVIMGFLIIILLAVLVIVWLSNDEPPPGSLRVVMCSGCGKQYVERVVNIMDPKYKCKYCGKKLGFAMKCMSCEFEYSSVPIQPGFKKGTRTMQVFNLVSEIEKCPNCGSNETRFLGVREFEKRK